MNDFTKQEMCALLAALDLWDNSGSIVSLYENDKRFFSNENPLDRDQFDALMKKLKNQIKQYEKFVECSYCKGEGSIASMCDEPCRVCDGSGKVERK